jgi:hypothetical protein
MGTREIVEKEIAMSSDNLAGSTTTVGDMPAVSGSRSFGRYKQESFFSKYKWYITVLVVVLVIGFLFWRYKKMKKDKPELKFRQSLFMWKRSKKKK